MVAVGALDERVVGEFGEWNEDGGIVPDMLQSTSPPCPSYLPFLLPVLREEGENRGMVQSQPPRKLPYMNIGGVRFGAVGGR